MRSRPSGDRALMVLLLGAAALVLVVLRPLARALFLAAVLGMVLSPVHRRLTKLLHGRSGLAAGSIVILVLLLVVAPLAGLSVFLVTQGIQAIRFVSETVRSEGVIGLVAKLPDPFEALVTKILQQFPGESGQTLSQNVQQQVSGAGSSAAAAVGGAVSATGSVLFQSVMMLLATFFFLTQRDALLIWVDEASPLRKGQTRELMAEFQRVCRAVIVASGVTALVQAVAALIGYFIARVPYPLFFAAVTFLVAFIPAVGAASVCLVAAALILVSGHPVAAAFLAGWGLLVVGLVDNAVKPLLIRSGMGMHGALVFFSLFGGLGAFGAVGLLVGPLTVALFLALVRLYQRDHAAKETPGPQALHEQGVGREPLHA